jgi:hypothetical protein
VTDSKIVVDADMGRVNQATKKVKEGADQAAMAFKRWGNEITNSTLRMASLVRMVGAIGDELEAQQKKTVDANRQAGGGALQRGRAIRELGLDNRPGGTEAADAALRNLSGGATLEERESFLLQLASSQRSAKKKLSGQDLNRVLNLQAEGVTGGDEILKAISEGNLDDLIAQNGDRRSRLSDPEQRELKARDFERQNELRVEEARAPAGLKRRLAESAVDARNAENPTVSSVQNLIGRALSPVGGDSFIKSGDVALFQDMNASLNDIARSNREMARGQPSLGTAPEGTP